MFLIFITFNSNLALASDLEVFFKNSIGNWKLVSGWSKNVNTDGSTSDGSVTTFHNSSVTNQGVNWTVYEDFCSQSNGSSLCGESLSTFEINADKLYLVDTTTGIKTPVEILRSTSSELNYRVDFDGLIFSVLEQVSNDVWTRTTQVQSQTNVIEVSFLALKRTYK